MQVTAPTLINGGQVPQVRLCSSVEESPQNVPIHWSNCSSISPKTKLSRYRNMFSNPMSPLTPSFGILPLESNTPEPTVPPTHTTLTEANDQKSLAKRVRAHVGVGVLTISLSVYFIITFSVFYFYTFFFFFWDKTTFLCIFNLLFLMKFKLNILLSAINVEEGNTFATR